MSQIVYSIDGNQTIVPGTASFTLTGDGIHTITFHAVDGAMNVEAERTLEIKIDKTFPVAAHNGPFVVNEGDAILLNGAHPTMRCPASQASPGRSMGM